jgi:hypothetical protein
LGTGQVRYVHQAVDNQYRALREKSRQITSYRVSTLPSDLETSHKACPVMIEHFGCRATGLTATIKDRSLVVWQLPLAGHRKTVLYHFKADIIVSRRYDRLLRIKDSTRFRGIVLDDKLVHGPRSPLFVLLTLGTGFYICQQSVGTLLFSFPAVGLVTVPNLF